MVAMFLHLLELLQREKFRICSLKMSWAQAASPASLPMATTGQHIRAQISEVDRMLQEDAGVSNVGTQPHKSDINGNVIKQLESSLANLPERDEFEVTREMIRNQILDAKQKASACMSIGAQIDQCKSGLQRSSKRVQTCRDALAKASSALEEAEKDQASWQTSLSALQDQAPSAPATSLEKAADAPQRVLKDMKTGTVAPEMIVEAERNMDALLRGLTSISQMASATAGMSSEAGGSAARVVPTPSPVPAEVGAADSHPPDGNKPRTKRPAELSTQQVEAMAGKGGMTDDAAFFPLAGKTAGK